MVCELHLNKAVSAVCVRLVGKVHVCVQLLINSSQIVCSDGTSFSSEPKKVHFIQEVLENFQLFL